MLTMNGVGILLLNVLQQLFNAQMRWQKLTVGRAKYVDQLLVNVVIFIKWNIVAVVDVVDVVNVGWQERWRRRVGEMETFLVLIVIEIVVFIIVLLVAWRQQRRWQQWKFLLKV